MSQEIQTSKPTVSDSRRRLIQGGLAGAPLLLMLKSAPALATYSCKQPSGFSVSGNLSQTTSQTCDHYYKQPSQWYWECRSSGAPWWKDKKVKDTLGSCSYNSSHSNKTMKDALNDGDEFLKYCAGAWANATAGGYSVDNSEVCKMWKLGPTGNYEVVRYPQVYWGKPEVLSYIKYTMGLHG